MYKNNSLNELQLPPYIIHSISKYYPAKYGVYAPPDTMTQ